jgi:hypothetical protein
MRLARFAAGRIGGRWIGKGHQAAAERQTHLRPPAVSVVVVVYNIPREAPRTLMSLSASYQRHIGPDEFEVIVVDNGSDPPFDADILAQLEGNFRLIRIDPAPPSPVHAINRGLSEAKGEIVGVMIDGARLVTPGLLHFARHGARLYDRAIVLTLGWYLGYDYQGRSMACGYDRASEDALLAQIGWPEDGYRLFEIATLDQASIDGWLQRIGESNALFMRREMWGALGGFDPRFDVPGGGLVNTDTLDRALALPGAQPVMLLSEGTFHQLHGGVMTNTPLERAVSNFRDLADQYESIRGRSYYHFRPNFPRTFLGTLPQPVLARFARTILDPSPHCEPPLGSDFDRKLWSTAARARPADPVIGALTDLAQEEFRAGRNEAAAGVAALIRNRAPDVFEASRILSLTAAWLPGPGALQPPRADYHLAMARAHRILGESELAASNYQAALSLNDDLTEAHLGLAELRMPGEPYLAWLSRLYGRLAPETLVEIGIYHGASLSCARPPTVAVGIDPNPHVQFPFQTETHIFTETSDAFFARRGLDALLRGRPLGIGFIDGLHLYEQALRDFIHLERYCGPRSVVLLHDTIPLDERTQRRTQVTTFSTGDVWKIILCLKHYRPELDIFTIATAPSGLTMVTGLNPASRRLAEEYEEIITRFNELPYSEIENNWRSALNVVSNDWDLVERRLRAANIF